MPDCENDAEKGGSQTRAEFEAKIVAKAWADPEYKKRLLTSPKEVLREELAAINPDVKLPESLEVYVHEETPNALHITLPVNPDDYRTSTGEEWMDQVAGGGGVVVVGPMQPVAVGVIIGPNVPTINIVTLVNTVNVNANAALVV